MREDIVRVVFAIARVAVAAAIVAAVVGQLITSLTFWPTVGVSNIPLALTNFFSFFTILSNVGTVVVMLIGAALLVMRSGEDPHWFAILRVCIVTYMGVTGIVYNLLLRNITLPQGSEPIPWSNEVLHLIGPLFLLADVFLGPCRRALPWRALWAIVAFPIAWVAYTMIRGGLVTNPVSGDPFWYPYPFLNPNAPGGWASVMGYVVGIALAIIAVGAFVMWWGRRIGAASAAADADSALAQGM